MACLAASNAALRASLAALRSSFVGSGGSREFRFVQRQTEVAAATPPNVSPNSTESVARWVGCVALAASAIHGLQEITAKPAPALVTCPPVSQSGSQLCRCRLCACKPPTGREEEPARQRDRERGAVRVRGRTAVVTPA